MLVFQGIEKIWLSPPQAPPRVSKSRLQDLHPARQPVELLPAQTGQAILSRICNDAQLLGAEDEMIGGWRRDHPSYFPPPGENGETAERVAWALSAAYGSTNLLGIKFYSSVGQTRTPAQVLAMKRKAFDCDEACLFYAALMQQAGVPLQNVQLVGIQPVGSPSAHMVLTFSLEGQTYLVDLAKGHPPIRPIASANSAPDLVARYLAEAGEPDWQKSDHSPLRGGELSVRTYTVEQYVQARMREGKMKP
ncbi:Uncharacterised protein [uncultured archaeon]|nr:Uncharacterised protein [uncultured archaeon]